VEHIIDMRSYVRFLVTFLLRRERNIGLEMTNLFVCVCVCALAPILKFELGGQFHETCYQYYTIVAYPAPYL